MTAQALERLRTTARWLFRPDVAPLEVGFLMAAAWTLGRHPHWIVSQVLLVVIFMTGGRFLRRHEIDNDHRST